MPNVINHRPCSRTLNMNLGRTSSLPGNVATGRTPGVSYLLKVLLTSAPLLAIDLLALAFSLTLASIGVEWWTGTPAGVEQLTWVPVLGFSFFFFCSWLNLYPAVMMGPAREFRQLAGATSLASASYWTIAMDFSLDQGYRVGILALAWSLSLLFLPTGRSICRHVFGRFSWWGLPAVVVGQGANALEVFSYLDSGRSLGLQPVVLVDSLDAQSLGHDWGTEYPDYWLVWAGDPSAVLGRRRGENRSDVVDMVRRLPREFIHTLVLSPELIDARGGDAVRPLERIDLPLVQLPNSLLSPQLRYTKRLTDVLIAGCACVGLLPLFAVIAGAIKLTSPGPVFYRHRRIGLRGHAFDVYKFRTMEVDADAKLTSYLSANPQLRTEWDVSQKLEHDPRITKIGRFLRKTSLDELPQIWNVLKGEMSLVGPRPIVDAEVQRYGDGFDLYKRVPPGITGLWQVYGRNKTTYERRVQLDTYYVGNWSIALDLYILYRTFKTVLLREGAY